MDEKPQGQNDQPLDQNSNDAGILGGVTDKLSSTIGGGQSSSGSTHDQSYLDKGISAVQQTVFGQSSSGQNVPEPDQEKQKVHSAVDQAHPEKIQEFIRDKYKSRTEEMEHEQGKA